METIAKNTILIDGYIEMMDNLSPDNKLDLISKLTASVNTDLSQKQSVFNESFGAFDSTKTADEIIAEIRNSRTFTRQIEEF